MKINAAGMALLKKSEGFRSRVYLDVAGVPTIGYGHRLLRGESFPEGIDEPNAARILAGDLRQAEETVRRLVKVQIEQGQFDALVDFCFNLGAGRLAASTLLQDLNAGKFDAAAEQLLHWDHAGTREVAALKARRQAEFQLWQNPRPALPATA